MIKRSYKKVYQLIVEKWDKYGRANEYSNIRAARFISGATHFLTL